MEAITALEMEQREIENEHATAGQPKPSTGGNGLEHLRQGA